MNIINAKVHYSFFLIFSHSSPSSSFLYSASSSDYYIFFSPSVLSSFVSILYILIFFPSFQFSFLLIFFILILAHLLHSFIYPLRLAILSSFHSKSRHLPCLFYPFSFLPILSILFLSPFYLLFTLSPVLFLSYLIPSHCIPSFSSSYSRCSIFFSP